MLKIEYLDTFDNDWERYTAPTNGNACFDLRSTVSYVLAPGQRALIPLGIKTSFPPEYELQLRPRSGLALKHGISFVNCVGTVDSSYRGMAVCSAKLGVQNASGKIVEIISRLLH